MREIASQLSGEAGAPMRRRPRGGEKGTLALVERACRFIESRREIGEGVVTLADLGDIARSARGISSASSSKSWACHRVGMPMRIA